MSDSSPPRSPRPAAKRPLYFVVALFLVWTVGLVGATDGCETVGVLRQPESARAAVLRVGDKQSQERELSRIDALLAERSTMTPLSLGRLLLGSLLTLAAGMTILGRQALPLARQALLAYALFLPVDYVVRRPIRALTIDSVVDAIALGQPGGLAESQVGDLRVLYWWMHRAALGAELGVLALGLFAMTRPRVRALFQATTAERAHEQEP